MVLELNKSNITIYLKKRKIIVKNDNPKIKKLSGGNVNRLFLVNAKLSSFVIKQTTPEAVNFLGVEISEERSKYEIAAIKLTYNNPQLRKYFAKNPGYKLREITTTTAFEKHPKLK